MAYTLSSLGKNTVTDSKQPYYSVYWTKTLILNACELKYVAFFKGLFQIFAAKGILTTKTFRILQGCLIFSVTDVTDKSSVLHCVNNNYC